MSCSFFAGLLQLIAKANISEKRDWRCRQDGLDNKQRSGQASCAVSLQNLMSGGFQCRKEYLF